MESISKYNLLVVDDEEDIRTTLTMGLEQEYNVYTAGQRNDTLAVLNRVKIDLLLLDLRLQEVNGLALHREIKRLSPDTVVVLLTGHADIDIAVEALQQGVADVITKPISLAELKLRLNKNLMLWQNKQTIAALNKRVNEGQPPLIARSANFRQLLDEVRMLANLPNIVLLTGESGTGKEVLARSLHASGSYADKPMVALNCSSIPANLIESELFGTEKGAYTGALSSPGKIEHAGDGILFLDEIGDMPLALQSSLLRVLDGHTFSRLGSNREIPVRCRFVAATNRDLTKAVAEGNFREDLYYRLNVVRLHIPPLRERREDIPEMVQYYLSYYEGKYGLKREMPPEVLAKLQNYVFPGNVRELRSVVERYILTGRFGLELAGQKPNASSEEIVSLAEHQRCYVVKVYRLCNSDIKQTASLLGITEKTVRKKLQEVADQGSPRGETSARQ